MGNMYGDSVFQWNVFKGCLFNCVYCRKSFQAQSKRQMHNCQKCYAYEPHFHEERLNINFNLKRYETIGDQFIWVASSGDINFAKYDYLEQICKKIRQYPNRTFFMQTKDPIVLYAIKVNLGELSNLQTGMTLETNRDKGYEKISKAPLPSQRVKTLLAWNHIIRLDRLTIEPLLDFDLNIFVQIIRCLKPRIVYVGNDTKRCSLPEPSTVKTLQLINELQKFTTVKLKYIKKSNLLDFIEEEEAT